MGLGYLQIFGYYLGSDVSNNTWENERKRAEVHQDFGLLNRLDKALPFNVFNPIARALMGHPVVLLGVVLAVRCCLWFTSGYLAKFPTIILHGWNHHPG